MLEKTSGRVRRGSKTKTRVRVVEDGRVRVRPDTLATEEPMEIRLLAGQTTQTVAVTMRTPGADFELAAGFLYGEGIIDSPEDVKKISYCVDADLDAEQRYNIVNVELRGGREFDLRPLERHFYTTSACGVCGKASLEQLELRGCPVMTAGPEVSAETIYTLPEKLREAQGLFDATGGLHAAALFDAGGRARRAAGRRRKAQRDGQARRVGAPRGQAAAHGSHRHGQRPEQLRDPAEVPDGGRAHRVRHLSPEQPRGRCRERVRDDPRRIPAREQVQRVRRSGTDSVVADKEPGARTPGKLTDYPPVNRATTPRSVW